MKAPPMTSTVLLSTVHLPKTKFILNNALPVEFLIDIGISVNIIKRDTFEKLECLM